MPARLAGPLAGPTGQLIAGLAEAEGLDADWTWLPAGDSRVCVLITDPAARDTLTVNEQGPQIAPADWNLLAADVLAHSRAALALTASGSLPPGVDPLVYAELLMAVQAERPVFLDTSGKSLTAAMHLPLTMLKINAHELGEALGQSITTVGEAHQAARAARALGPQSVVVTLGRLGAVAVDARGAWHALPPTIAPVSPVGSGDTLLAGVAAALLQGEPLSEALRRGVACGAANALMIGPGAMRPEDIAAMRAATQVMGL